jgi:DNA-binding CsgD family transcriptional regulator
MPHRRNTSRAHWPTPHGPIPARPAHPGPPPPILTARQREVAVLVALGLSSKQVARQLGISIRTVESHRGAVMRRLAAIGVEDLPGLVRLAVGLGWVALRT